MAWHLYKNGTGGALKKLAVVDFDKTLIKTDSFIYMMMRERWFLDPAVFVLCARLFLLTLLRSDAPEVRDRLKYRLLKKYSLLSFKKRMFYIETFKRKIDWSVADSITKGAYDRVVVASASEEKLICSVLSGVFSSCEVVASRIVQGEAFKTCYGKEKYRRLKEYLGEGFDMEYEVTLYTDSRSDADMGIRAFRIVFCD